MKNKLSVRLLRKKYIPKELAKQMSKNRRKVWKANFWKLHTPIHELPAEDLTRHNKLRCHYPKHRKDDAGNILEGRVRCKSDAAEGSLYCKGHLGGTQANLKDGGSSTIINHFRKQYHVTLGSAFDRFLNDPSLLDLKPYFAQLGVLLSEYVAQFKDSKVSNVVEKKKIIKLMKIVLKEKKLGTIDKFDQIRELVFRQEDILNGDSLDRIRKLVETISKVGERISKIENRPEFMLTPDGYKMMLRQLTDIIKENLPQQYSVVLCDKLMYVNTRTKDAPIHNRELAVTNPFSYPNPHPGGAALK